MSHYKDKKRVQGYHKIVFKGEFVFWHYSLMLTRLKVDFGGGGRVRTRNTLHIVVARKSSICYDAVEGREKMKEIEKEREMRNVQNMKILKY